MTKGRSCGIARSKWFLPSFSLVLGLVMLAVSWLLAVAGLAYVFAVGWFRWRG